MPSHDHPPEELEAEMTDRRGFLTSVASFPLFSLFGTERGASSKSSVVRLGRFRTASTIGTTSLKPMGFAFDGVEEALGVIPSREPLVPRLTTPDLIVDAEDMSSLWIANVVEGPARPTAYGQPADVGSFSIYVDAYGAVHDSGSNA